MEVASKNIFPSRIKALREAIGVTQEEFANALSMSRPTISYYEKGERTPDIDVLDRIHRLTGCSTQFLMGYSDNMKPDNVGIGHDTGLSDKAIEKLRQCRDYSEVINFLVEHEDYARLANTIGLYSRYDDLKLGIPALHKDNAEYFKFVIHRTLNSIIHDFALSTSKHPADKHIGHASSYENQARCWDQMFARSNKVIELDEQQRRKDKLKELLQADMRKQRQEHNEKFESDPFYRFHHRMIWGNEPPL